MAGIHFLITRFNIRFAEGKEVSESWTRHRWELFQQYCLPSIEQQTCRDFHWLLYISPNTPKPILKELEHTASRCAMLRIVPIADDVAMKAHWKQTVQTESQGVDWVATSRLDSDDALALDFIASVQAYGPTAKRWVINYNKGLTLLHQEQPFVYQINAPANPYISLVEPVSHNIETIVGKDHQQWLKDPNYKEFDTDHPMWLQIIHQKNVINEVAGTPIKYNHFPKQFGIPNPNYTDNYWLKSTSKKLFRSLKNRLK